MKAISIRNPYAHFILCGEKTVECRSWQTDYRGDLLICSSANPKIKNTICGHALCIARLDSIEPFTKEHLDGACMGDMPEKPSFAWHLTDIRVIKPFPVKGKLNFFNVDDDLIEIIDNGDDSLTEKEADELYKKYFEPLLYNGRAAK